MASSDIGIKIGLTGAEAVQSQLAKVEQAMGGVDAQTVRVADAFRQLGNSTAGIGTVGQAMAQYTQQTRDARVEANLLRQANRQLAMQMTDVVTSLASGMPAWMVFIQQGGQIKDSYGGIGQAIQGVTGYLRTLINPLTVAGAAFAAVGAAAFMGSREMDAYVKALTLSGNAAGTTAGALDMMAKRIDSVAGTQGKAAQVLAQLAESGDISAASLERVALAAIELERAGGPAVQETAKQFASLAKEPLSAAIKLNESTRFLTLSVYEQVKALESQGRSAEAATTAMEAYAKVVEQRTQVLEDQLGYIEKSWRAVKDGAKEAWDAMADMGRKGSVEKQLQTVRDELAKRTSAQDTARSDNKARYQPAIDALRLQEAFLQEQVRLQARGITLDAERAAVVQARAEWDKKGSQYLSDQQKMQKEITEAQRLGLEGKIAQAEVERRIAAIRASYAGKGDGLSDEAKATGEAVKVREKYLETLSQSAEKMVKENQTMAEQVAQMVLGKQAFQDIISAREEEQAVLLETQAIRALDRNLDAKEFDSLKAQAAAIRERISLRKALATATVEAADREIMLRRSALKDQDAQEIIDTQRLKTSQDIIDAINREADALKMSNVEREVTIALLAAEARGIKAGSYEYEEYAKNIRAAIVNRETVRSSIEQTRRIEDEWRRTTDQIGQSLSDALMQGGKSAWEYIKSLFRSMVLRPVIQAIVNPVAGAFTAALGFSGAASASSGASALGNAGTLASAYNALNTGVSTAITNGFMKLAESPLGAKLGLSTPFDGGTGFTANIATSSSNSIASALGTAGGTIFGTAAGMAINKAISNGFQVSSGMNTLQNIGTAVASYMFGPIGGMVAGAISGAINRVFGRRLADVGLQGTFGAGAGFEGQSFQFYEGGFFRSDKTVTSPADAELQSSLSAGFRQIQVQTALLAQTVGQSAEEIGNFTQDIRLSFKGLTEDQIKEKLAEQLTSVQEQLAGLALGAARTVTETISTQVESWSETEQGPVFNGFVDQVQEVTRAIEATGVSYARAGETNVQTLTRLAGSLSTINPALDLLGLNLYATSLAGADLASQLADAFGGLENFTQSTASYYAEFFTEAERAAKTTEQLTKSLGGLGLALPTTRDAYRQLVEAQDLTTEAGRKNFAVLVQLSGTFASITPVVEDLADASDQATEALRSAADILRERQGLERQLLQLQGNTTALRALDRAALDESNRALFDRINALQDSQAAAAAAAESERTLAAERERIGQERAGLERQLLQLQGNTTALRALDRAALDESNRALFDRINALQDSQAAEAAAAEATRTAAAAAEEAARAAAAETQRIGQERLGLERQLLQLQGNTTALRALDRAALDASNRALYDQIQALQDTQAAAAAAAESERTLAAERERIAQERAGLERQLLQLQGNTTALRALDRAALDESNRALFDRINALQDSQAAEAAAAEATRTAAAAAEEAARAAAAETQRIGQERLGLERQLLQLQGNTTALRALDRAALDASNRALYDQIQALQDTQAAAAAAAESERTLAAERERIAQERAGLERQLLQLQGNTTALRALDRAALDASNRALYDQIQALQDTQAAATEAAREQQALADAMAAAGRTVESEIRRLRGVSAAVPQNAAQLQAQFAFTTAQARAGSTDALSKLPELSAALESATALSASNAVEMARLRAWLAGSLSETLQTLGLQVPALATGTNVVPRDMLALLHKGEAVVPAAYNPALAETDSNRSMLRALQTLTSKFEALQAEMEGLRAEARSTAVATNKTARILDRVTPDGTSLQTVAAT